METTAKQRVEQELDELNEKIAELSIFLYGRELLGAKLTPQMNNLMHKQKRAMEEYATILQNRLEIWGLTEEELKCKKLW